MTATDELREWAKRFDRAWFNGEGIITFSTFRPTAEDVSIREIIESIADRIDAEHRKALEKVAAMVDEPTALDKLKGHLDGLDKIAAEYRFNIVALERRVSAIERKLNHRGER